MGEQFSKERVYYKVDLLPAPLKEKVDNMLLDKTNTYKYISEWLKGQGENISRAAIGRYAISQNKVAMRFKEAQEQTRWLIEEVRRNPNTESAEVAAQIMLGELLKRVLTAEEEFDNLPLDKVGRLIASLERSGVAREKLKFEFNRGVNVAAARFKEEIRKEIQNDPELVRRIEALADKTAEGLS